MAEYKLLVGDRVLRVADGLVIPSDPRNRDRAIFDAWAQDGNTPDPADPLPESLPTQPEQLDALAEQARAALAAASTLADVKGAVSNLVAGMKAIYGVQD